MIILYGSNGSPFVSRIRMQGYAKELPIALRQAALGTPEFRRLNPLNKGPVLEHDGLCRAAPSADVVPGAPAVVDEPAVEASPGDDIAATRVVGRPRRSRPTT